MKQRICALFSKYRSLILYAVFGVLTTLVNMASYQLSYRLLGLTNVLSTVIAWVLAVLFAVITNKLWVFESKSFERTVLLQEMLRFFGARAATGLLDVGIMYVSVDLMHWDGTMWKLISNVIVIVINYIMSKMIVFKNREKNECG